MLSVLCEDWASNKFFFLSERGQKHKNLYVPRYVHTRKFRIFHHAQGPSSPTLRNHLMRGINVGKFETDGRGCSHLPMPIHVKGLSRSQRMVLCVISAAFMVLEASIHLIFIQLIVLPSIIR